MVQERLAIEQADAQERAVETIKLRASELARSQAALQEHSRVLDAILESIGEGVVVVDPSGCFTIINAAARSLLGDRLRESTELPLARAMRGEAVDSEEM